MICPNVLVGTLGKEQSGAEMGLLFILLRGSKGPLTERDRESLRALGCS